MNNLPEHIRLVFPNNGMNIYNRPKPISTEKTILVSEAELVALKTRTKLNRRTARKEYFIPVPGEDWKPIPGTFNEYYISSLGRLRREICCDRYGAKYSLVLQPREVRGLLVHRLYLTAGYTKFIYIHKTVKETFHPTKDKLIVYHVNGNTTDNRLENLKYRPRKKKRIVQLKTIEYINSRGEIKKKRSKISAGDVEEIHKMWNAGIPQRKIAEQFNISQGYVSYVLKCRIKIVDATAVKYRETLH